MNLIVWPQVTSTGQNEVLCRLMSAKRTDRSTHLVDIAAHAVVDMKIHRVHKSISIESTIRTYLL